jgi:hypothetical protein
VDLSSSEELQFDHGVMVPLHLLGTTLPVIPIIVNCLAGLPAPLHRCHALGVAIRRTVDRWPERVAILGTGGLSHWPAMPESGRIGLDFDRRFIDAFVGGRVGTFLGYSREALEAEAGPGGHEIRTWIAVAGAAGDSRGSLLVYQPVPAWSTGCAVATPEPRQARLHARASRLPHDGPSTVRSDASRGHLRLVMGQFGVGQAVKRFGRASRAWRGTLPRGREPAGPGARGRHPLRALARPHRGHRCVGGASRGRRAGGLHGR